MGKIPHIVLFTLTSALLVSSVVCLTSILYQKIGIPDETVASLVTTTITAEDGVKQCGIICSLKRQACNIFKQVGNLCTYGHIFCVAGSALSNSSQMYIDPVFDRDCGGWGEWSSWSCASCAQQRKRVCDPAVDRDGAVSCSEGEDTEEIGGWGEWSYWSCDGSSCRKQRKRGCDAVDRDGAVCQEGEDTDNYFWGSCPCHPQCKEPYTNLSDPWRRIEYRVEHPTYNCDKPGKSSSTTLVEGWYRFYFPSAPYAKIPTTAPLRKYVGNDRQSCGTYEVSWMDDSLPDIGDRPKDVTLYFAYDHPTYTEYAKHSTPTTAKIVACPTAGGTIYLYYLSHPTKCHQAYCAM